MWLKAGFCLMAPVKLVFVHSLNSFHQTVPLPYDFFYRCLGLFLSGSRVIILVWLTKVFAQLCLIIYIIFY
jgi:hypothetical protein